LPQLIVNLPRPRGVRIKRGEQAFEIVSRDVSSPPRSGIIAHLHLQTLSQFEGTEVRVAIQAV